LVSQAVETERWLEGVQQYEQAVTAYKSVMAQVCPFAFRAREESPARASCVAQQCMGAACSRARCLFVCLLSFTACRFGLQAEMDSSSRALAALRDQLRVTLASLMPQAETMMINEKFREAETLFLRACRGRAPAARPRLRRDSLPAHTCAGTCARVPQALRTRMRRSRSRARSSTRSKRRRRRAQSRRRYTHSAHGCTHALARMHARAGTHALARTHARTRWLARMHARARTQVDKTKREANELMDLSATLVATHNFDLAREKIKKAVQLFSTIHESQAVQNAQSSMLDIDRRATQCAIF
jgi:hypothetical protein